MHQGDFKGFAVLAREEARHPARLAGMSLFWAWLQIVFALPDATPDPLVALPLEPYHQIWTLGLIVTVAGFAIALASNVSRFFDRPAAILSTGALMALGTACLGLSAAGIASAPLSALGAVATGLGSAGMFLGWGLHLSRLEPRRVLFDTAVFSFLTAVFYGLCCLLPSAVGIGFAILMPPASGLLLIVADRRSIKGGTTSPAPRTKPMDAETAVAAGVTGPRPASLMGLAVLVGIVFGIIRGASLSFGGTSVVATTQATVIGVAVAGLLLAVTAVFFRKESELYLVCEVSFPLLSAGYLLLPSLTDSPFPLPLFVFTVGHTYFYFMLWVFCVDQCRKSTLPPGKIFAAALLAFLGSSLAGSLLSDGLAIAGYESGSLLGALSIVVAYSFILVLVFLFSRTRGNGKRALQEIDRQRDEDFRCSALRVAENAALTPRETEIFLLLVEGLDRAAIREQLVISNDTVKTHIRRLYAKLDIHSKQDARRLVEERLERDGRGM